MISSALKPEVGSPSHPKEKSFFREYGEALAIAFVLAVLIRSFLFQAFSIPSGSMERTLLIGDYLLVNKLSYGIRNPLTNKVVIPIGKPHRGDVVVFIFPQDTTKDYIKRIIGLPGDKVQVINKKVYINNKVLNTPQARYDDSLIIPPPHSPIESPRDNFGPVEVPPNSYFVMGDNRDHSYDSRFWGFVPMRDLKGKATIIYFSWAGPRNEAFLPALWGGFEGLIKHFRWDSKSFRVRWDRLGKLIH
jgi:signal peptidase I